MVQGISKNPLTDISKVYLEQVSIDERLGGKGYKRRKDYAGRTVEGDWPDSDRGGGHKAKKRAGEKVEKKSPTYRAHVLNKEEVEDLNEYSPNVTYQAKGGRKSGKLGKSSVYSLKDKSESKKEFRKSQVKDIKGGYLKTEERELDERTLSSYIPSDRQGEARRANLDYTKAQLKKKEDESTKNRGDLSKRDAGKMAKEKLHNKKIMSMGEAKVDKGRSDYGKASIRNYRSKGPGYGEPAMFDPENKRGKLIDKRREEHKARRGVKGAKVPAYKTEEVVAEADKKGKGSGTKDACYHKVKASAKVWPSAYASGRLVQCRKKGASNYGKSKTEEFEGWATDPILEKVAAWQRKEGKRESGGLNQKGVDSYRRENPGSKLKTAVTTKPSKLKKGSKSANRRKSFCARMSGMKKKLTSAKTANDPDSRINKSLRKWNCSYEPDGTPIMEEDKAFNFVLDKIRKEVGKDGYVSKNNPRKPQTPQQKAKVRAHQAKVDAENAAERKKDPSQGRYPKG